MTKLQEELQREEEEYEREEAELQRLDEQGNLLKGIDKNTAEHRAAKRRSTVSSHSDAQFSYFFLPNFISFATEISSKTASLDAN